LKVSGVLEQDISRLRRIAGALDRLPHYVITLDGNEQFPDAAAATAFWRQMQATPELKRLAAATLYIEQPLPRAITLNTDVTALADATPVLIDEADNTLDAFMEAISRGYTGVSSKNCKGFYRSLLNAARCTKLNSGGGSRYFMSAEDLTTQAGLAVQQDLALVNLLGLTCRPGRRPHRTAGVPVGTARTLSSGLRRQRPPRDPARHPRSHFAVGHRLCNPRLSGLAELAADGARWVLDRST
jgi:L-alanine-DL-glutamate epimerase-like enolase superfamily enzyme